MTLSPTPFKPASIRCRLGLHRYVPLEDERARMNRFMRMFIVRRIDCCQRCGQVLVTKLTNSLAGGGTHIAGYMDPVTLLPAEPS